MFTTQILRSIVAAALAASCLIATIQETEATRIRRSVKRRLRPGRGFFVNRDAGYGNHNYRYNARGSHHAGRYVYGAYDSYGGHYYRGSHHGGNCGSSGWHNEGYRPVYRSHHNHWYGY